VLSLINKIFISLLLFLAASAILASLAFLSIELLLGPGTIDMLSDMDQTPDFFIDEMSIPRYANDSPRLVDFNIHTPPLTESSLLFLDVYANNRFVGEVDCLYDLYEQGGYVGLTEVTCTIPIPYNYEKETNYKIYGILSEDTEYLSNPVSFTFNWSKYEETFWWFSTIAFFLLLGWYIIILVPVAFIILNITSKAKHKISFPKEYSIHSLINPLANGTTHTQKFYSFLFSPYFWAVEAIGVLLIITYMALSAGIWKSASAFMGFALSGMAAFVFPFLWCAAWWFLDFKEREPVRILVTLFFWGMLSALMAIGINSIAGIVLGIIGLGFLSTLLVAPIAEEAYKGSGVVLLSEHHEFGSIEDGIIYGFVIGMGFAFIENWIYFLDTPLGSDIISWITLFILRSIVFSANHGAYTAITGAVIALFVSRGFKAPGLGILIGMPIAATFHMMHNSAEIISAVFGAAGLLMYCCFLVPIFDYGGVILIAILFFRAVLKR
jgi:RsiW-degrading membrane proteinase PrsW (M82 family)